MKNLIKHLVRENIDTIVDRSLLNCHATGLHSIMLIEKPEQTIRMFYTHDNHTLWKNNTVSDFSLAIHSHHCNITLMQLFGRSFNIDATKVSKGFELDTYLYQSEILTGKQGFTKKDKINVEFGIREVNEEGIALKADQLHTVYVPEGDKTAWIVVEGREDPNYDSLCYSNTDLTVPTLEQLYIKPSKEEILEHLAEMNLI